MEKLFLKIQIKYSMNSKKYKKLLRSIYLSFYIFAVKMAFRPSYQAGGYPPGPPIGDGQNNNKRNGQRVISQGNMSPQAIAYIDQTPNPQLSYTYVNPMQQQQPLQQVQQVPPYGRAVGGAGPQAIGGNIHVLSGPPPSQPPQIQAITSAPGNSASSPPTYVVSGNYITAPPNPYQYHIYTNAQNKQIPPNAIAAQIPQNMAYTQIIPEGVITDGDSIYQSKQQYMSRSPKPIQAPTHLPPPQIQQIPLKNVKPEINMQSTSQMQQHYGMGMANNQMRQPPPQQQQMIQQQDNEGLLTSESFKPNMKQPPGLFNIVPRGNLPAINFVCDVNSCYGTE